LYIRKTRTLKSDQIKGFYCKDTYLYIEAKPFLPLAFIPPIAMSSKEKSTLALNLGHDIEKARGV